MQKHVTVIGAGIVGISCARHLQRLGFKVTVVDRLAPGEATSFGNACVITDSSFVPIPGPGIVKSGGKMWLDPKGPLFIRAHYLLRVAPWLVRFVRQGSLDRVQATAAALSDLLRNVLQEHKDLARGTDAERWISDDPTIFVYDNEADYRQDAFGWNLRREHGTAFTTIDGKQLHDLEPALAERFSFGVIINSHGKALNPSKLVKAHAAQFEKDGGEIKSCEIQGIELMDGKSKRLLSDKGPIDLDILLIAAGPWSARLSAQLGDRVPLESEGGYHATLGNPGFTLNHSIMSSKAKVAVSYMEQGLRIGGLVEFAGLDSNPDYARTHLLLELVKSIFPSVNTAEYTEWRGHRPTITDSLPVIGRSPQVPNVYYAFGHQHVGLSSGPKTGKLIAQLIAERKTDIDLHAFRVDRF